MVDYGLVPLPTLVDNYLNDFWPEATAWIKNSPWLLADDTPDLVDFEAPAASIKDQVMADVMAPAPNATAQATPNLPAQPAVAPLVAAVAPDPVPDIQNFIVLLNAVLNGGRLTNRSFPLPCPHLQGAAVIQPPFVLALTSELDKGFPC